MTHFAITGIANEVTIDRRISLIGTPQRNFLLDPVLISDEGVCSSVVVIAGGRGTYVYASDSEGDIADYTPLAVSPGGTSAGDMLAVMGYLIGAGSIFPLRDLA